jgi:hypothetical protein
VGMHGSRAAAAGHGMNLQRLTRPAALILLLGS